jgi:methylated-DNA-protein-cysteine methyltransferase related protein
MAVSNDVIFARIRRVPPGFVTTYGDLTPGAPRLSARALSRGHPDDVPWWRVVRSDGSLTQGERQRQRLMEEDIPFRRGRVVIAEVRIPPEAIY